MKMKKRSKSEVWEKPYKEFFQKPKRNYENVWESTYAAAFALRIKESGLGPVNRFAALYAMEVANHAYVELKFEDERHTKQLNEPFQRNVRRARARRRAARIKKGA